MSDETINKELLQESIKDFKFHFDEKNNSRIIFSAPFGTGKTTFLKEFSKSQTEHTTIHLFPVNYSVASNEDIFQLIKHDILLQILGTSIELEKINFTHFEVLGSYIPEKIDEIFNSLLSFVPKTGKQIIDNIKPIYNLLKKYKEYHNKIKEKNEEKEIIDFLSNFTFQKGSIYEEDFITLLIKDLLSQSKDTILIIDDLDRIDPEHIFRILNIFSAHIDYSLNENKFGFSKIILVCDIENIRTLFKHKYGVNTDFSGYIDKFYSREIYHFTNYNSLIRWLNGASKNTNNDAVINENDIEFIADVLCSLIRYNKINFRNLKKIDYNSINSTFSKVSTTTSEKKLFKLHFSKVGYLLKLIFGDIESCYQKLNEISLIYKSGTRKPITNRAEKIYEYYSIYLLPILSYHQHKCVSEKEIQYFDPTHSPNNLNLKVKSDGNYSYIEIATSFSTANNNFWDDLRISLKILEEAHAL